MLKKIFSLLKKGQGNLTLSEFSIEKRRRIISKVESLIGSKPNSENYYIKAFTHRSYLEKATTQIKSNERLEFLGDSILGKIVAEYLFKNYLDKDEGFLTKSRSKLVNKHSLEKIGYNLKLDELLFINDKYIINEKKKLSNIISDSLEALIAAIYLDQGEDLTRKFVIKYVIKPQIKSGEIYTDKNYKGQLLEYCHANKLDQPIYKVINQSGPQHDKTYTIEVNINDKIKGIGVGPNKKNAEQNAAKKALKIINSSIQSE